MQALMVIAAICAVSTSKLGWSPVDVEEFQMKCQKALIVCYEKQFPKPSASEVEWIGGMKTCIKERVATSSLPTEAKK